MDWFTGTITDAISSAKTTKGIFVVLVHGADDDEASKNFIALLEEDEEVYSKLQRPNAVCIRVQSGTQACTQFSQFYPVVLVPSIYFIESESGVDIEVTGGSIDKTRLLASIEKALTGRGQQPSSPAANSVASPRNERVEEARRVIQNDVGSPSNEVSTPTTSLSLEERVERAKRLLAEKQAMKVQEVQDKEKNSESERREMGKSVQDMKRQHEDDELRQVAVDRRNEKEETRMALQKVKEQIAQDRADRAAKFNTEKKVRDEDRQKREKDKLQEEVRKAEQAAADRSTIARIQFRLPDGTSRNHNFSPDDTLDHLYRYVTEELTTSYGSNISLSTTFPSRQLDIEARDTTLRSAGLVPSTTILVRSRGVVSTQNNDDGIMGYVWLILTPVTVLLNLLRTIFLGSNPAPGTAPTNNQNRKRQAADGPSTSDRPNTAFKRRGVRTEGNIARLTADDDDDESNTYNGNSTQQM